MSLDAVTTAPEWCQDPRQWFPCPECAHGLVWDDLAEGELLVCVNVQCFGTGMPVPIWRAQQHREDLGLDRRLSPAGWPRPILDGRPVPYAVPVTAGHPWWRLTHGARLLLCQNDWRCQVCGLSLEPAAWVLVDSRGAVQTDAAMHSRCLRLATATCPHLLGAAPAVRSAQVQRTDIRGDGRPLRDVRALTRELWTVPRLAGTSPTHGA